MKCEENLNFDDFSFNKKKGKRNNKCKICTNEKVKCIDCKNIIAKINLLVIENVNSEKCEHESKAFDNSENWTLFVSPFFCGKTYILIQKILSSEFENPDRKMKNLPRYPNQDADYDTEEEISINDEYKDCFVVFDDMLVNKQKDFSLFSSAEDIKTFSCNV